VASLHGEDEHRLRRMVPSRCRRGRAMPHRGSGEPIAGRRTSRGGEGHVDVAAAIERGTTIRDFAPQGVVRPEECKDLRSSLLRRIAVLCPFVGSAVGSRCLTARGYKKEIEWVSERDGWSTFGILT